MTWTGPSATLTREVRRRQARALDRLALHQRNRGRYDEAERLARRALSAAEESLGPADPEVAAYLNDLGVACKYSGRFDEAEALYRRALGIAERAGAAELTATLCHNLGGINHARGRHVEAEPWARRAVELRQERLGVDHPAVVADIAALASIIDAQDRHREAEPMFRHVLSVFEAVYGGQHPEVVVNLNNLAACLQRQGRLDEAHDLYRRTLRCKEQVLGADHPDVAVTLNNLALLQAERGHLDDAWALMERAVSILTVQLGVDHPTTVSCCARTPPASRPAQQLLLRAGRRPPDHDCAGHPEIRKFGRMVRNERPGSALKQR